MLKIGEFSRLTRVPAKTLRYYDEIDLFKPFHNDATTGYRHYTAEQLPRLHRIMALKGLGLSLDQIKMLLDDDVSPEEIRGMLKMKRVEIINRLEEEKNRLLLMESYLSQIENEGRLGRYDVVLKPVEPVRVLSVRGIAPTLEQVGTVVDVCLKTLQDHLHAHHISNSAPHFHIYHDEELLEQDLDIEVAYPISDDIPDGDAAKVRTVEGVETMACAVHHGPFVNMLQANVAIMQWISANGYHVGGPYREVYLQYKPMGDQKDCVTEVQFPVIKGE